MEPVEDTSNVLLETIRKEMVSIIEERSESSENNFDREKERKASKCCIHSIESSSADISARKGKTASAHESFSKGIDNDIQKLQSNLDDTCKLFQTIGERFESINFGYLKNRIKDLRLNERNADSVKTIVNDLKHSFDEKYMENRLNELTEGVTTKFRDHPGEFGDIPEISEFFRTCSNLEHGLEKLRKERNDCMNLQKRITRAAEASYERINELQQKLKKDDDQEKIHI